MKKFKIGDKIFVRVPLKTRTVTHKSGKTYTYPDLQQHFWGTIQAIKGNEAVVHVNTYTKEDSSTDKWVSYGRDGRPLPRGTLDRGLNFYQSFPLDDLQDYRQIVKGSQARGLPGTGVVYNPQTDRLQRPPQEDDQFLRLQQLAGIDQAFNYLDKYKPLITDFLKTQQDPQKFYINFFVNQDKYVYNDFEKAIQQLEAAGKVSTGFAKKLWDVKKKYASQKVYTGNWHKSGNRMHRTEVQQTIVGKIDNVTVVDRYGFFENKLDVYVAIRNFVKQSLDKIRDAGYDMLLYGQIVLDDPRNYGNSNTTIANYIHPPVDKITLKVTSDHKYNEHAVGSLVHQFAHRLWYVLMNGKDWKQWNLQYNAKMYTASKPESRSSAYPTWLPDIRQRKLGSQYWTQPKQYLFPRQYATKNVEEYFACVVQQHIMNGKIYSQLLKGIF